MGLTERYHGVEADLAGVEVGEGEEMGTVSQVGASVCSVRLSVGRGVELKDLMVMVEARSGVPWGRAVFGVDPTHFQTLTAARAVRADMVKGEVGGILKRGWKVERESRTGGELSDGWTLDVRSD